MRSFRFFSRASDGSLVVASHHPANCNTWHWAVALRRRTPGENRKIYRAERRNGQWHDYYPLPFGWQLIVSRQDYHKGASKEQAGGQ